MAVLRDQDCTLREQLAHLRIFPNELHFLSQVPCDFSTKKVKHLLVFNSMKPTIEQYASFKEYVTNYSSYTN